MSLQDELQEWSVSAQGFLGSEFPRLRNVSIEEFLGSGVPGHPRVVSIQGWIWASPITIGSSRITFHHFTFRELFLVIISSWLTSKNSGRIISRNLPDLHLLPHFLQLM